MCPHVACPRLLREGRIPFEESGKNLYHKVTKYMNSNELYFLLLYKTAEHQLSQPLQAPTMPYRHDVESLILLHEYYLFQILKSRVAFDRTNVTEGGQDDELEGEV